MGKYENNHYIQKAFIKNYFKSDSNFVYDVKNQQIIFKKNENIFSENKLYWNNQDPEIEKMLNDYIENEGIQLIKKISDENWDGRLTRLETYKVRKYILINFLRHPIWYQEKLKGLNKTEWLQMIKNALMIDPNKYVNSFELEDKESFEETIHHWFIRGTIMQFVEFQEELQILTPASLCNQVFSDWSEDKYFEVSKQFSNIKGYKKFDSFLFITALVSKKRAIILSDEGFGKFFVTNCENHDEATNFLKRELYVLGMQEGLYLLPNLKIDFKNENEKQQKIQGTSVPVFDKNDIFNYQITKLSSIMSTVYISNFLKTIGMENACFDNLENAKNQLKMIQNKFEIGKIQLNQRQKGVLFNYPSSEEITYKVIPNDTFENIKIFLKLLENYSKNK